MDNRTKNPNGSLVGASRYDAEVSPIESNGKKSRYHYVFPADTIELRRRRRGDSDEIVNANVVHLTRFSAYWGIHRWWRTWRGPFLAGCEVQPDEHWRWVSLVRRFRKDPLIRCAALKTSDGWTQGAIIYRRDGASMIDLGEGTVYIEYLAAAPWNRRNYALDPLYLGVGEGLVTLAVLHSYAWDMGGRVSGHPVPGALNFYKKQKFIKTESPKDRKIHCELPTEAAIKRLVRKGYIDDYGADGSH